MGNTIGSKVKSTTLLCRRKLPKIKKSFEHNKNHNNNKKSPNDDGKVLRHYLPNFEKDTDIMVILHFLGCYLFQSPFNVPIGPEQFNNEDFKVLDACCGAGTWLLDLATIYRSPKLYGFDLCPIYPTEIKPDNVEFMQHDILNGIPHDDNTFDYVHLGNLVCNLTLDEWKYAITELIRVCKPGGYLEFTEPELATNTGPILTRFYNALLESSDTRNVKIRISKDIIRILESLTTVTDVQYKARTVSLGSTKGGNAGQAYFEVHDGFFLNEPMPEALCQFMGLTVDEYKRLFDEAKEEVHKGIAPDCDIYRIWCQKI